MKSDQFHRRILGADLAWIPAALATEQSLHCLITSTHSILSAADFLAYFVCATMGWILLSERLALDGFRGGWRLSSLVSHLLLATALLAMLLLAFDRLTGMTVAVSQISTFSVLLLLGFLGLRGIALQMLLRRHRQGDVNRVVILGSDRLATELAKKFEDHPEFMCKVVGFLCPMGEFTAYRQPAGAGLRTVSMVEMIDLLTHERVNELILAHTPATHEILQLIERCGQRFITVSLIPEPYELYLSRPRLMDLGGLPLLQLAGSTVPLPPSVEKRLLDVGLSLALAPLAVPVVLGFGLVLRFSTGKAFCWESRVGRDGALFSMLRLNVERDGDQHAPFLSRLSISELPQLWNVLRGEMSLVGPRPEGPERVNQYSAWQRQRLKARPGITGLAQVCGLREQHSSEQKARLDLQYMLRPSLLKDLSLLIETVWTLTRRLIKISADALAADLPLTPDTAIRPVPLALNLQPFPEALPHAHRTQPGSN
ncbi:MAG: sugar transferase [Candidatus Sulfotelmatobacter sp.]